MITMSVSIEALHDLESIHGINAVEVMAAEIATEISAEIAKIPKEPGHQNVGPALLVLNFRD